MSSLSWKKAAGLPGLGLTKEEKNASAWPDSFEFRALSVLQYPGDGTPSGGKVARSNRKALLSALTEAAGNGKLSTERRKCSVEAFRDVPVRRCPYEGVDKSVCGFTNDEWRQLGGRFVRVPAGFEEIYRPIVSRLAFRQWLDDQGEPPSVHVQAWFDSVGGQSALTVEQVTANHDGYQPMKRAAIISQLGRRYPGLEADFNRPATWIKDCSAGARGMYYLERVEEGCRKKWGNGGGSIAPVAVVRVHKLRG